MPYEKTLTMSITGILFPHQLVEQNSLFQNAKPFTWLKKTCFSGSTTFTNRKLRFTEPA